MYAPRLLAYIRALLASQNAQSQAEDVLQGVMCKVLKVQTFRLRQIKSVDAWLFAVSRSVALNHLRGERREFSRRKHFRPAEALNEPMPPSSHELVRRSVEALEPEDAEIVTLRYVAGLTFGEIGELVGLPRSTVACRHERALKKLREALGLEELEEESGTGILGEVSHG